MLTRKAECPGFEYLLITFPVLAFHKTAPKSPDVTINSLVVEMEYLESHIDPKPYCINGMVLTKDSEDTSRSAKEANNIIDTVHTIVLKSRKYGMILFLHAIISLQIKTSIIFTSFHLNSNCWNAISIFLVL